MKQLLLVLFGLLVATGTASAQRRIQVGIRGGINASEYKVARTRIGDYLFTPGPTQVGYEAGFVLRINLSRHLHLQSEFNYDFVNYSVRARSANATRNITLRTERLEIPVQLGLQFGMVRIFGGAQFRVADTGRSSSPQLLKVKFNDDDIAVMGGIGLNIRKFFFDLRVSGYPRSHVWQSYTSRGVTTRVKVPHDIVYGGSLGFFF